ncbi:MAG: MsnO8 family LLM class oxidoreductase [Gammaproteobacteria bacterium]|nr:MsnO8 family LLM class oxidoreductase [Gammaproteobacteria bacterium]
MLGSVVRAHPSLPSPLRQPMQLSILDQSIVRPGSDARAAFAETLALARHAERLGYERFWVSEHHDSPVIAGSSPEVLLAAIGAATTTIRIGSGGVMLPHYSAYKVAENFAVLSNLYPGRVDLGVGRAPGADMNAAIALAADGRPKFERFPQLLHTDRGAVEPGLPPARGPGAGRTDPGVGAGHQPRQRAAGGRTGAALRGGAVHQPAVRPAHRRGVPQSFPPLAAAARAARDDRDERVLRRRRGARRDDDARGRHHLHPLPDAARRDRDVLARGRRAACVQPRGARLRAGRLARARGGHAADDPRAGDATRHAIPRRRGDGGVQQLPLLRPAALVRVARTGLRGTCDRGVGWHLEPV